MPRAVLVLTNPTLKFADTEAGLSAGTAYECQVTSAAITPTPKFSTVAATGCAGESESPGASAFALELAFLQDWHVANGLSEYLWDGAGEPKWVELVPQVGDPAVKCVGEVYLVEPTLGGTFGDGSAAASTVSLKYLNKPTLTAKATVLAAAGARSSDD
jgi:hypothetical protein